MFSRTKVKIKQHELFNKVNLLVFAVLFASIGTYVITNSRAATIIYLSPTGNDSSSCTQSSPCKSLARAYQVAASGDTVKILDGTYGEQTLNSGTKSIIFESAGPGRPAFGKTTVDASNLIIRGLQFESRSEGGPAALAAEGANNIYDNIIVDGQGKKLLGMGLSGTGSKIMNSEIKNVTDEKGMLASGDSLTVDNVYVHDVTMSTYGASVDVHNECIYAIVVPNFTLKNSKFWNCSVMDVFFTYGFWWDPKPPDYGNVTIENNVFDVSRRPNSERYHYYAVVVAGTGDMRGAGCFAPVTNWKVRYNSFMGPMIFSENEAPCSVTRPVSGSEFIGNLGYYECLGGNTIHRYNVGTACAGGVNNKNISPNTYDGIAPEPSWFLDPLNNNFKLTANSPAIDAGDPTNFPARDKDGNVRNIGPPDAGAYEYGSGQQNGGTDCTKVITPNGSLQDFFNSLKPGDVACLRSGIYEQEPALDFGGTASSWLTIKNYPGEQAIIKPPQGQTTGDHYPLRIHSTAAYVKIQGLIFQEAYAMNCSAGNVYAVGATHDIDFINNEFRDSKGGSSVYLDESTYRIRLIGNKIHGDVDLKDCSGTQAHGIYMEGSNHLAVNNVIYDHTEGWGIQMYDNGSGNIAIYNTIVNNKLGGFVLGGVSYSDAVIANNIIVNNGSYAVSSGGSAANCKIQNNIFFGNSSNSISPSLTCSTSNNRIIDPLFTDLNNNNFKPKATSPAIDSALPDYIFDTDFENKPRPIGSGYDIGAFEYQSIVTKLPGDVNLDKTVNIDDLSILLSKWNTNYTPADFYKDNTIDISDLSILLGNWGKTNP